MTHNTHTQYTLCSCKHREQQQHEKIEGEGVTHTEKEPRKLACAVGRRECLRRLGIEQAHALARYPARLHQRLHALLVALCVRSSRRGSGGRRGQRGGERGGCCGREMRERYGRVGPCEGAHVLLESASVPTIGVGRR